MYSFLRYRFYKHFTIEYPKGVILLLPYLEVHSQIFSTSVLLQSDELYFLSPCYEFESHLASQTFTDVNVNRRKGVLELTSILKEHQNFLVLFQYAC